MKKLSCIKKLKIVTTHLAITCLMFSPWSALPIQAADNVNPTMSTAVGVMNIVGATANQFMKQQQMMQQQMQMMAQMATLKPQPVPSKFFGCMVGPAIANMPKGGFCPKDNQDPSMVGFVNNFRSMKSMAEDNSSFFEKLMTDAQNDPNPTSGISCLNDRLKKSMDQMQMQMNSLQDLADKIAKENQTFKEQNKVLIDQMKDIHADLNGGAFTGDQKARRFAENFSPACVQYMGGSKIESAKDSGGLLGIRKSQASFNDKATALLSKRPQLEKDLVTQISEFKKAVALNGIEKVLAGNAFVPKPGIATFQASMQAALQSKGSQISLRIETIKGKLQSELGYSLPEMDGTFNANIDALVQNAENFFTKKKVEECARGSFSLSNQELISSLRHTTSTNSDLLNRYRTALQGILGDSKIQADVKAKQIQELDKQYGGKVVLQLTGSAGQDTTATPYAYMQEIIKGCKDGLNYNQLNNGESVANGGKGVSALKQLGSEQDMINAGKKYLQEIADISKNSASEMANEIYDQIANCSGRKTEVSECSGDASFDANANGFCIKNAVNCSQQVNSCYREIDVAIKTRQTKMNTLAATYDKNVAGLVAKQEGFLQQVKSRVAFFQNFMTRTFPGTAVELKGVTSGTSQDKDGGLFVSMPEKILNSELGVYLRGGGDIKEFDKLPEKIVMLKDSIKDQQAKIKTEVEQFIAAQQKAMDANKKKWEAVAKDCVTAEKNAIAAAAKANQEAQKAAAEAQKKQGEFCSKFASLKSKIGSRNPAAACGEPIEGLMKSLGEATNQMVGKDAATMTKNIDRYCSGVQASGKDSKDDDDEEDPDDKLSTIAKACKDNNFNSSSALADIVKKLKESFPDSKEIIDSVEELLSQNKHEEATTKISEIADNEALKKSLNQLQDLQKRSNETIAKEDSDIKNYINQFNSEKGICYGDKGKAYAKLVSTNCTTTSSSTGNSYSCTGTKDKNEVLADSLNYKSQIDRSIASAESSSASKDFNSLGLGQMDEVNCLAKDDKSRGLGEMTLDEMAKKINSGDSGVLGLTK